MEYNSLLKKVLEKIKPTKEEKQRVLEAAHNIISIIKKEFNDVRLMGSLAKDTFLKGDTDADIFVFFDETTSKEEMGKKIIEFAQNNFEKVEIKYAEHPYARVYAFGIRADIVPAYNTNTPKTAVDRTPHHLNFVKQHMDEKMKDEVRLLKAFLKGLDIYGAEIKTQGFSGYLCELLIIHYKTFINLLNNSSKWKKPTIIALNNKPYKTFDHHFVVIDPTDPNRNVASAVSLRNFAFFIAASRAFLNNPSIDYFLPQPKDFDIYNRKFITVALKSPDVSEDIKYGQLNRIKRALTNYLKMNDFGIIHTFSYDNGKISYIIIELSSYKIPGIKIKEGPFVYSSHHSSKFVQKDNVFLEDDRLKKITKRNDDIMSYIKTFVDSYNFPSYYRNNVLYYKKGLENDIINFVKKQLFIEHLVLSNF